MSLKCSSSLGPSINIIFSNDRIGILIPYGECMVLGGELIKPEIKKDAEIFFAGTI